MDAPRRDKSSLSPELATHWARLHAFDDAQDVWVFGYGSLLWKPGFNFVEQRPARLYGYHRSFCIYSAHYRGNAENIGLVLGLDRGGSCQGIAFRLAPDEVHDILDYLWDREMLTWDHETVSTVYDLKIVSVRTDKGPVHCRTFVANRAHEEYAGRLPEEEVVRKIQRGAGVTGTNREYLQNTVGHLDELGIGDGPLHRLLRLVEAPGT
ncbi:MAG: gamma-glutamylcyclotransferase [Alphaproteobacteria bacterium]|nr:gamma-glutamylcyclotransferase [Alphaproteobacteria bacterium]